MGKIYISGPITGNNTYVQDFSKGAEYAKKKLGFTEVVNPAEPILFSPYNEYEDYIKRDLKWLLDCSDILMLPGWEQSRGATLENTVAKVCGLKIHFKENENE
jgi:hypothetical protein